MAAAHGKLDICVELSGDDNEMNAKVSIVRPRFTNFMLPAECMKHAITFLSFFGKEKLSTQGNLFEVIQKFGRRFVVDNHIDWFGLSGMPENSNTAFILGTTADKESSPLRLLLEDKSGTPKSAKMYSCLE